MADNNSDNISLSDIKTYASRLKSFYLGLILFCTAALKKFWYILLAGIVLGGGLALYKYKNAVPYFEGKASFTYSGFTKKLYGEITDKLRGLVASESYKTLGEKLNISEADARMIIDIEGLNIAGSPLSDDITESKHPFYIRVKLSDKKIADSLLICLENYFNNNPQVNNQMMNNLSKMKDRLKFINDQLQRLDSLKSTYQFYLAHQNANSGSVINTFNPVDLFTESEKLLTTKTNLEWSILNFKVVRILDPFVINDSPVTPVLASLLLKYAALGLFLSCAIALLLYILKTI